MDLPSVVRRFDLYGEERTPYTPDLVHLETIAARAVLHNWVIGAHRHPSIVQLLYIDRGRGALIAERGQVPLPPPSLVLMPCDCPHAFRFGPDADGWVLSVAIALFYDPRLSITHKEQFLRRHATEPIPLGGGSDHASLIKLLFRDIERRRVDANIPVTDGLLADLSLLFSLTQEIASAAVGRRDGAPPPRRELFSRFMQLVEQNYRSGDPVSAYADALGASQATLTRACGDVTGKAPGALINERRLLEAKRSLSFTTASVKQIADDLGYHDPAYFARSFRRYTGTTASEFRCRMRRPVPRRDGRSAPSSA